jgi:Big-like domain-containing protein
MTRALRIALVFGSLALPFNGCSDNMGPPPPISPLPTGAFVSAPLLPASPAAPVVAAGTSATEVTYVSLAPGTAPDGRLAVIRNTTTGDTLSVPVGAGGFDPVAVPAAAGDTLDIAVQLSDGSSLHFVETVPLKRSPGVVRTYPPSGKRDVPLNATVVIVFSQPVDPGTVTASTVQLRRGSTTVIGTLALSDPEHVVFIPAAALEPSTLYTLVVTADIRDVEGDVLQEAFTAEFTTAATATGYEEYFVDAYLPPAVHQIGDSAEVDGVARVMDGTGTGIERALIRFRSSVGRVEPDTTSAGLDGLVSVHWKFAGFIGILPPQATAELTACASNSVTRCDQSWSVVVIGFNPP